MCVVEFHGILLLFGSSVKWTNFDRVRKHFSNTRAVIVLKWASFHACKHRVMLTLWNCLHLVKPYFACSDPAVIVYDSGDVFQWWKFTLRGYIFAWEVVISLNYLQWEQFACDLMSGIMHECLWRVGRTMSPGLNYRRHDATCGKLMSFYCNALLLHCFPFGVHSRWFLQHCSRWTACTWSLLLGRIGTPCPMNLKKVG